MAGRQTITVAVAINDGYIDPLLVVLLSACRNLSDGWELDVFILGYRISDAGQQRLESALDGLPVRLHWLTLDLSAVQTRWPGLGNEDSITVYYRLFLAEVLPRSVDRVLYLDADLLVEGDLAKLWSLPFDGHVVQAVPDAYACRLHIPRLARITFSENIRFSPETPYFNAGVLLIDLRRWREENVGKQAVSLLWKYGGQLAGRDQDALNCSLAGRWKRLPPTWNFHELPEHPHTWEPGGASAEELREAFEQPAIIHFIGWKPWCQTVRPLHHERWWAIARPAGVPPVKRPLRLRLCEALVWQPHARLRRYLWRRQWLRIPPLILARPWILFTYPLWRAAHR
jgi:lipopolysaccharide biosynthesis glycosyltransferase